MRDCLGVSIGATNLVAARVDGTATVRPASVTWRGTALTGFVERVGDPIPIVAPDGSAHDADRLIAAAVADLIRTAGRPGEPVGIALPSHWRGNVVGRLRALLPDGVVTSDAVAALTALRAQPGLPSRGVVLLCDFGATGTSVTLADAAADFRTIGATARIADFSGESIDRALLAHLLTNLDVDAAATSAVAALSTFRDGCRIAKERLSFQTAIGLPGPRPGTTVRLTRAELEALIRGPLDAVLAEIDDLLTRNGIRRADLVAVASVGGGSRIAVITQRLSESLRMPVTTTPQAQSVAAIGAALIAGREPEAATRVAMAPRFVAAPPAPVTPRLLAWSSAEVAEPVAFADDPQRARPDVSFLPREPEIASVAEPLAWYRRPAVLFAGAACAAVLAATGLVITTDLEAVGSTAATIAAPSVSAVPSESPVLPTAVAAAAPQLETVTVTPPPNVVRYTPAPQAPEPARVTQVEPAAPTPETTTPPPSTTTSATTETTTTSPTPAPATTSPPASTTPATTSPSISTSTVTPTISSSVPTAAPTETPAPGPETSAAAGSAQPVTAGDTESASR